ncbi:helix-turn-helix transcriptional regulator [Streptomyces alkaliphilus]|uniref:WYL domain-containing protein n=1 Tax=Streptomyces alkaliphilus TaxID=1472722 RepID=A0A7W3T9H4_9ACTN|nr:YafY family protein [Streptomyces alkaliphilus]MBB0242744.1 WYL domain-containing protein [Streptomyces alkaliphilus]MQS06194.1 WYL domain-containing protein [Streptomyces alkaliphilus]
MADVTQRVLALLATLQTGRAFTGEELAARLDVSPRTLRRDIDRLRGYGYPVKTRPGPGGHYRLAAGSAMPPLALDDDEAIATLLGLATLASTGSAAEGSVDEAATRAYGKVDQYLPKRLRHRAAHLRTSLETGTAPTPSISADTLASLADAIRHHTVVTFDYTGRDGSTTSRRVHPYRHVHHHLRWYLLARDTRKDDWRVFRIDRITRLRMSTSSYTPRPLPADTALDYLRRGFDKHRERVVVTVDAPLPVVAEAFAYRDVELVALGERRTRAVLMLDTWQWLLPDIAFLEADFTVEEPAAFRDALRAFGARLLRHG